MRIKVDHYQQNEMNIVLVGNKCDLLNRYKYIYPIDRVKPENMNILVYGYLHKNERNLGIRFIPEEIKRICVSYIEQSLKDKRIEITPEMGKELAKSWENHEFEVPFIETSAKDKINVEEVFEHLVRLSQNAKRDHGAVS